MKQRDKRHSRGFQRKKRIRDDMNGDVKVRQTEDTKTTHTNRITRSAIEG